MSERMSYWFWLSTPSVRATIPRSKERLIMEDKSTSTIENLEYSYAIIEERGLEHRIAIVTNEFHECRASLVAKKLGLECYSVSAHTHWWFYPTYLVREWFGVMYEYCR